MLDERLSMSTRSRALVDGLSASGSTGIRRALHRETSIVEVVRAYVVTSEVVKTSGPSAELIVGADSRSFPERCGEGVVTQIRRGGEVVVVAELTFATRAEREAFSASASLDVGVASGTLSIATQRRTWNGRLSLRIHAFQHGGRPQNLLAVTGGSDAECGLDNLVQCERRLARIREYIGSHDEYGFVRNVTEYPGDLSYTVTPLVNDGSRKRRGN